MLQFSLCSVDVAAQKAEWPELVGKVIKMMIDEKIIGLSIL